MSKSTDERGRRELFGVRDRSLYLQQRRAQVNGARVLVHGSAARPVGCQPLGPVLPTRGDLPSERETSRAFGLLILRDATLRVTADDSLLEEESDCRANHSPVQQFDLV